jgi:hypothetical protein
MLLAIFRSVMPGGYCRCAPSWQIIAIGFCRCADRMMRGLSLIALGHRILCSLAAYGGPSKFKAIVRGSPQGRTLLWNRVVGVWRKVARIPIDPTQQATNYQNGIVSFFTGSAFCRGTGSEGSTHNRNPPREASSGARATMKSRGAG